MKVSRQWIFTKLIPDSQTNYKPNICKQTRAHMLDSWPVYKVGQWSEDMLHACLCKLGAHVVVCWLAGDADWVCGTFSHTMKICLNRNAWNIGSSGNYFAISSTGNRIIYIYIYIYIYNALIQGVMGRNVNVSMPSVRQNSRMQISRVTSSSVK